MVYIKRYSWLVLLAFSTIGIIYPPIGVIALVCMLAPIVTAPFMARKWCGNFCPRGSLNDIIIKKYSKKKGIPKIFKTTGFKIILIIVLMGLFIIQISMSWGDVWAVGAVFVRMILITTLIDIILGLYYHHRAWCSFCPMGTMGGWLHMAVFTAKLKKNFSEKT